MTIMWFALHKLSFLPLLLYFVLFDTNCGSRISITPMICVSQPLLQLLLLMNEHSLCCYTCLSPHVSPSCPSAIEKYWRLEKVDWIKTDSGPGHSYIKKEKSLWCSLFKNVEICRSIMHIQHWIK